MRLYEELEKGVLSKVTADEPIFVLRGKDALAVGTIEKWMELAEKAGVSKEKIDEADALCGRMEAWQRRNGCKVPD